MRYFIQRCVLRQPAHQVDNHLAITHLVTVYSKRHLQARQQVQVQDIDNTPEAGKDLTIEFPSLNAAYLARSRTLSELDVCFSTPQPPISLFHS
jgi:hypothetical protein